jgi:hypothetical protein
MLFPIYVNEFICTRKASSALSISLSHNDYYFTSLELEGPVFLSQAFEVLMTFLLGRCEVDRLTLEGRLLLLAEHHAGDYYYYYYDTTGIRQKITPVYLRKLLIGVKRWHSQSKKLGKL